MLNIPESVKTLFKTASVRKNFRVHFPNGEYADLTNRNIVAESVRFSESICSKEVFQYGLSERSSLEFECVGVTNIYGLEIEASIEIDLSGLPATDRDAITADPGDGEVVAAADSEFGADCYRVPYGVFVVESCPKSHGAMSHRRVTAYAKKPAALAPSSFMSQKLSLRLPLDQRIRMSALAMIADASNDISDFTTTEPGLNLNDDGTITLSMQIDTNVYLSITSKAYTSSNNALMRDYTAVYKIDYTNNIDLYGLIMNDLAARGYAITEEQRRKIMMSFWPSVQYKVGGASPVYGEALLDLRDGGTGFFYPYTPLPYAQDSMLIRVPHNVTVCRLQTTATGGTVIQNYGTNSNFLHDLAATAYRISWLNNGNMTTELEGTAQITVNNVPYYSYIDAVDMPSLLDGYAESVASFKKYGRDGALKTIQLSTTPITVGPSEFIELWFDDYDIDPIGSIVMTYRGEGRTDNTVIYYFGEGGSQYTMGDNYLFRHLSISDTDTNEAIETFLEEWIDTYFAPQAGSVQFTPTDLEMIGMPWIEAGDYLEVEDTDGNIVLVYVLSQEISGVQTLFTSVAASGGEIITEV